MDIYAQRRISLSMDKLSEKQDRMKQLVPYVRKLRADCLAKYPSEDWQPSVKWQLIPYVMKAFGLGRPTARDYADIAISIVDTETVNSKA